MAWLATTLLGAEASEFLIQTWTHDNGLPANTVTAVAQTPEGYLWVGTFRGLSRFDGVRFVSIGLEKAAGVSNPGVTCLYTDRQGTLWIGVEDGHLIRFGQDHFTAYLPPSRRTADCPVRRVVQSANGLIWTLNYEGIVSYLAQSNFIKAADRPDLITLTADASGTVCLAASKELLMFSGDLVMSGWSPDQESGFQPEALAPARAGGCWIAGNGCLRRFEGGQWRETRATLQSQEMAFSGLVEDQESNLWLSTYRAGIIVFNPQGEARRLDCDQGLPSNLVRCLFEDQEGNIWAGLEGKGLARIQRALFASYQRAQGLTDSPVLSLCEGSEGEMWVGTNGDGLFRIGHEQIRHYGSKEGLDNAFVWALYRDCRGTLWAGTWGGGLFRLVGEHFVKSHQEQRLSSAVLALHEDVRGSLWLGQRFVNERRIDVIEQGKWRAFEVPLPLPRIDVRAITETPDGSVWFGSIWGGLIRWKNGIFTPCDARQGLPPGPVACLHTDDAGTLWVAVEAAGLVRWEKERFTRIAGTRFLADENIRQITDDGLGYLWCGLRDGVVRIKRSDLLLSSVGPMPPMSWQRFSKADGLPNNECSGTGCRTRDGRIWFATMAGVTVVNPRLVTAQRRPFPVLIEEVYLGGKLLHESLGRPGDATPPGSLWNRPPPLDISVSRLSFPSGSGPLEIAYTALCLTAPERVQFRYQMVGLDTLPVAAAGARVARYNYLPPGCYEFQVTAAREVEGRNQTWARLSFEVLPRYWQAWWFQSSIFGTMLGLIAMAARTGIARRYRRQFTLLQQQRMVEEERLRIARDLHDDLGATLTEINLLSSAAARRSPSSTEAHELNQNIMDRTIEMMKSLDEIVWAVNPKNDSLANLARYLCLYAQAFLRSASIRCRLDLPDELPELPLQAQQRHILFLATKEALANVVKHSAASEVWLRITLRGSLLTTMVEDNGRGFDAATLRSDGHGLKNMENRMRQLGGRGMVRSQRGQGTRVELELPLQD